MNCVDNGGQLLFSVKSRSTSVNKHHIHPKIHWSRGGQNPTCESVDQGMLSILPHFIMIILRLFNRHLVVVATNPSLGGRIHKRIGWSVSILPAWAYRGNSIDGRDVGKVACIISCRSATVALTLFESRIVGKTTQAKSQGCISDMIGRISLSNVRSTWLGSHAFMPCGILIFSPQYSALGKVGQGIARNYKLRSWTIRWWFEKDIGHWTVAYIIAR